MNLHLEAELVKGLFRSHGLEHQGSQEKKAFCSARSGLSDFVRVMNSELCLYG